MKKKLSPIEEQKASNFEGRSTYAFQFIETDRGLEEDEDSHRVQQGNKKCEEETLEHFGASEATRL